MEAQVYCAKVIFSNSFLESEKEYYTHAVGISFLEQAYKRDRKKAFELIQLNIQNSRESSKYCLAFYHFLESKNHSNDELRANSLDKYKTILQELVSESEDQRAMLDLGRYYREIGCPFMAISYFEDILQSDHNEVHVEARIELAQIYGYGSEKGNQRQEKNIRKALSFLREGFYAPLDRKRARDLMIDIVYTKQRENSHNSPCDYL